MDEMLTPAQAEFAVRLVNDRYAKQASIGAPIEVELYPDQDVGTNVDRWCVRHVRRGLYRGLVIIKGENGSPPHLRGIESSKIAVGHWLRNNGVPVLRIGILTAPTTAPIPFHLPTEN